MQIILNFINLIPKLYLILSLLVPKFRNIIKRKSTPKVTANADTDRLGDNAYERVWNHINKEI